MNRIILLGNIATDPKYITTQSGISNISFRIAVQRRYKNNNGEYDSDFITCVAWRQTADFIHKYFIKGNKIGLEGALQVRSYTAQDGSTRWATEVVIDNVEFVAPRAEPSRAADNDGFVEVDDDQLPF